MSIYERDLRELIQVPGALPSYRPAVVLTTANGPVQRPRIEIEVSVIGPLTGQLMPFTLTEAVIAPDEFSVEDETRLSGMFLRQNLFTATAPDGLGTLFIAPRKSHITFQLPAVSNPQPPTLRMLP
jgi:hypothetical protein